MIDATSHVNTPVADNGTINFQSPIIYIQVTVKVYGTLSATYVLRLHETLEIATLSLLTFNN